MENNITQSRELRKRRFGLILNILEFAAIPICQQNSSSIYIAYNTVAVASAYSMTFAIIIDAIVNRDDLNHAMETARAAFGVGSMLWVHVYLRFQLNGLDNLINLTDQFTWEELPQKDPNTGQLTMAGMIPRIQIISKNTVLYVGIYHLIQTSFRMVRNHAMVFNTWYPFDTSVSPIYEVLNISQFLASIVLLSTLVGFIGIYAILVCIACSQLVKLKGNLMDIRQKSLSIENESDTESDYETGERKIITSDAVFIHMQNQLNNCIRHHQRILKYMRTIEEVFSFGLCVQFLILLLAICMAAFSAVTNWGDHADLAQCIVAYCLLMANVYVICWFGTQLTEQAESVRNAAWNCMWVGAPIQFQKTIFFIIAKANREFTLTVGRFAPVSNTTMLSMFNQTMSFFMFLLQMMKRREREER